MAEIVDLHRLVPRRAPRVDARSLERELRRRIEGEVRFDDGSRALYATDASNYRQVPIGVVVPRSVEDVVETVAACRRHGAPLLSRGGGTSLAGQCTNVAVVVDWSKYLHRVLELDPRRELARYIHGGGRRGEIYARLKALRDRYADRIRARFPQIPRRVSGYNLDQLLPENGFDVARALVGSEGTCVTILEALLRLVPSPP